MSQLTQQQEARLDAEARALLAAPAFGLLIRDATGASHCGRRDRGRSLRALDIMISKSFAEPALAEALVRAIGMAWRERLSTR
jgi:hypothetical protein